MHITDPQLGLAAVLRGTGKDDTGGVKITVSPEFASRVAERTRPYKNFPRTMKPALEKVADYVRIQMIPQTFEKEGPGWRPLARRTQHERSMLGFDPKHPILRRTGDLFQELSVRGHPNHIEVIKTGKNARVIISGSSEKFRRNQGGNWLLHIPARPMIPGTGNLKVSPEDRKEILNILKQSISQITGKGAR